ncbi:hypothetical protein GUJ93_ZPchr0002g23794 [Zizania palustris]|uniref:dolichol kinase n=1 Tax=Zizania palustris TaxID=103762 RepID=A0A8J5VFN3_ZIZPA|nr:hypothetical protein GUJ93_ZPchr0002g23794 [Zizania palustris]
MNAFTDHRDSEILIVSHFSLLLGCALPKWMSSGFNDRPLAPFAGILSLGIGDTMASMIGYKYGVLRWSKTGKKTIEGTAAGITSVLAACSILLSLLASSGYILSQHWLSLLVAVTLSGLLEAYTAQLDNAFIPLLSRDQRERRGRLEKPTRRAIPLNRIESGTPISDSTPLRFNTDPPSPPDRSALSLVSHGRNGTRRLPV